MRIPEAKRLIQSERKIHPKNLCLDLLESHADLYELFFNESKEVFKTAYPMFSARIEKFEKAPQNSPYRDYGLGVLYLSKAAVAIRFEKNLEAAWAFRKAYFYFKDNKKNFPQFSPNDVYYGLLTTLLGSVPNNYQWLLNIIGMPGDINRGIALVHKSIQEMQTTRLPAMLPCWYIPTWWSFLKEIKTRHWRFLKKQIMILNTITCMPTWLQTCTWETNRQSALLKLPKELLSQTLILKWLSGILKKGMDS
jgi:hypothetical protein